MELFDNLALGFGVAFTLQNLMYAFIGCLLGTLIGVLPGIGPLATIAMLLPATYALPPVAALIMLAGIYYGAQYGGSTTAILVNLPGESSSVVTVIDGYQMARQGRAGPALAAAGLGSFFAGCVGTLILAAFAAPLTELAFKFGPAEYFSLMILGLVGAVVLASGSLIKAIAMIVLGLLLGMVGTDVNSGVARFSLDIAELTDGIGFIVIAMGVFGYGEIISNLSKHESEREVFVASVTGLWPTKEDFRNMTEVRYEEVKDAFVVMPKIVKQFLDVTQDFVDMKLRNVGGTPFFHIRHLFEFYDYLCMSLITLLGL
jgi:TctA family transporter